MFGQITIDSKCIPNAGDVLTYEVIANFEDDSSYLLDGEDLSWSYDNLSFDANIDIEFLDIAGTSIADSFPNANAAINFAGFLSVADISMDEVNLFGLVGNPLSFLTGDSSKVLFSEPFTYKKTPINYGDAYEDDFEIKFTFPADIIPGADSIMLPIPGASLDSARVRILVYKSEEVTAWGNLSINGNSHEVIKVKQIDTVGTILEAGVSFLGNILWLDASTFVDPNEFGLGLDQNTTTYKFLSNNSKESVLEVRETMVQDSTGNEFTQRSARAGQSTLSNIIDVENNLSSVTVSPNPTSNLIRLESSEVIDLYQIYSSAGQKLKEGLVNRKTMTINVSDLQNGTYILRTWTQNAPQSSTFIKQ